MHIKLRRSALIRVGTERYAHEPAGATPPPQISFHNFVPSWMPRSLNKKQLIDQLVTFIEIYVESAKRCNVKVLWFESLSYSDVGADHILYKKNPSPWAIRKADLYARSKRRSVVLVVPYIC